VTGDIDDAAVELDAAGVEGIPFADASPGAAAVASGVFREEGLGAGAKVVVLEDIDAATPCDSTGVRRGTRSSSRSTSHKNRQTHKKSGKKGKKKSFSHDSDNDIDPLLRQSPPELLLKSLPETSPMFLDSGVVAVTAATTVNYDSDNDSIFSSVGEMEFDCLNVVGNALGAVAGLGVGEVVAAVNPHCFFSLYLLYGFIYYKFTYYMNTCILPVQKSIRDNDSLPAGGHALRSVAGLGVGEEEAALIP
jgi:hypothetical protein